MLLQASQIFSTNCADLPRSVRRKVFRASLPAAGKFHWFADTDRRLTDASRGLTNADGWLTNGEIRLSDPNGRLTNPDRGLPDADGWLADRSEEHTSELQSRLHLVC